MMPYIPSTNDTITAIATPFGLAGIGIIRISGPKAKDIRDKIFHPIKIKGPFKSHRLYLGHIIDPLSGKMIDEVLLSYMKAPYSYTKEDVIEINSHSGHILLSSILQIVLKQGARLARPGEFTFRAFSNGRIDLTQAEAIVDLINARSEKGIEIATRQIKGEFKSLVERFRQIILGVLAQIEVAIDFPDDDENFPSWDILSTQIENDLVTPINKMITAHPRRKIWVEGVKIVIAGRVNAGKSSLLNKLLNEQRAIVTPIPGTTRDFIESTLRIEDIPVRLIDTAGLRKADGEAEKMGMIFTENKMSEADIVLIVIDRSRPMSDEDRALIQRAREIPSLIVINKIDLPSKIDEKTLDDLSGNLPQIRISAIYGQGIDTLTLAIKNKILESDPESISDSPTPNLRHKECLAEANDSFKKALFNIENMAPMEIIAEDLHNGLDSLGEIIGGTSNEDLYERIFKDFCIGK